MSNRSNESRRIFPFNICTISHICTTEFAVDSFSPLTTRFSLTLFTWVSLLLPSLFRPNHLMNMKNVQRVVHFLVCSGIFDYFWARGDRNYAQITVKLSKWQADMVDVQLRVGVQVCVGVCCVCKCVSECSRLLSFNYTKVIWCKKRNKCVCARRQQTENVLNPHTKKKKVTPHWAPNLMLQRLQTDERRWRRQQSAFNCAWKCWRNKNNNSNNALRFRLLEFHDG